MYDEVRNSASDEIPIPEERIVNAEIEITDTPVLTGGSGAVVIEGSATLGAAPAQVERVEKIAAVLGPRISGVAPANSQRAADHYAGDQKGAKSDTNGQDCRAGRQPILVL